ncbi:MAG: helix-turn-helix transcriptional regulator [Nitrosopumilus sp.]|nr:helix-turn-helix transcriptional regulator [Nitrosopumilus sp.]
MLTWQEIINKYIIKHSNRVKSVTRPLRDNFGIHYFYYYRIDNTGKFITLLDRPEWAEHYVSKQIYLTDPYLRHPSVYQSGACLVENYGSEEFKELVLHEGKSVLNMDIRVMLIKKQEQYVEFFGFNANNEESSLQNLYLNRLQLLNSFATHFTKELFPILKKMEEDSISLIPLKGDDFFFEQTINPDINPSKLVKYYKDIGVKFEFEKAGKLSKRERQCLKLLIEDKTAKEIAVNLGLSRRTIESYFENIKDKLTCFDKHELITHARTFKEAGLL